MSEVTAEQAKGALEVMRELGLTGAGVWVRIKLEEHIKRLEREQAREAKREERIVELADELARIIPEARDIGTPAWCSIARNLTELHPSLLDETGATS